jgi:aspartyl-tRNA(Asn)/glutamyl-tRNA(Gln) amidotransferase subunit A
MSLLELNALALRDAIARGDASAFEAAEQTLDAIRQKEEAVGAYISSDANEALSRAESIDRRLQNGDSVGPLAGVPIAVKDNFCTAIGKTTCGSKMLQDYAAPYDATVVERLQDAGAVIVGKCNMDEFGMGSSTENSALQATRNPWDLERVPGGSSGGSAAAVAAEMCFASLGSDTGGSIRLPAAFCGVVGMKPSYGRVSRYGLVAYGSSLDQIGPLARTAEDCALLMNTIAGHDPRDSTSAEAVAPDYLSEIDGGIDGVKVGIAGEFDSDGLDDSIRQAWREAADDLKRLGADIVELSLPTAPYWLASYAIIAFAEASSNLARYDGVHYGFRTKDPLDAGDNAIVGLYSATRRDGFGEEVKRRIILGSYALSSGYYDAYYLKALKVRRLIKNDFDQAFQKCDVLLCPTAPTPPFRFGEKMDDPLTMYLTDIYTIGANLAGLPALSMPAGFTDDGLPIGMQLMAAPFEDSTILRVAHSYQGSTEWGRRKPPICDSAARHGGRETQ